MPWPPNDEDKWFLFLGWKELFIMKQSELNAICKKKIGWFFWFIFLIVYSYLYGAKVILAFESLFNSRFFGLPVVAEGLQQLTFFF